MYFSRLRIPVRKIFSFYQQKVPGIFYNLGGMPKGGDPLKAASHHTPDFFIDESGLQLGVESLANLAIDYMEMAGKTGRK